MKKTMNINIAGQLFRIDEDAWEILTRYLDHVSVRFRTEQGGDETLADIESRIAEIFGGGKEPPSLVSKEMVNEMINTMGAPEDYYDDTSVNHTSTAYTTRKSMYDPNSPSARAGRALSEFFRAFGKVMSALLRVIAIFFGVIFTIVGFVLLFSFAMVLFFHDAPFLASAIEPEMTNIHTLLSIVLNSNMVWPIIILTAIVILVPLIALTYLGIKLIFNIKERLRVLAIVMTVIWFASVCCLGVFLGLQLSVYSNSDRIEKKISLEAPPKILWIAPLRKSSDINYDETASIDHFTFYRNSSDGRLHATADLNIYGSDTTSGWISVEKRASSNSDTEAWANARAIDYGWKFSGDTLYLDEFFSLPAGSNWNGSFIDIDISLPEGTEVRFTPETSPSQWQFHIHNIDGTGVFRIEEGQLTEISE
jgi:heme/copper-type cytochrome/quinol oxidase subunit 2